MKQQSNNLLNVCSREAAMLRAQRDSTKWHNGVIEKAVAALPVEEAVDPSNDTSEPQAGKDEGGEKTGDCNFNCLPAVVYKEHTLGLLWGDGNIEVLHSSLLKGARDFSAHSRIIYIYDNKDIRAATAEDFEEFRVCHHESYLLNQTTLIQETVNKDS